MERALTWEFKTIVDELTRGRENAKQLQFHLGSASLLSEARDLLLQSVLSSYEKALSILKSSGSKERYENSGVTAVTLESSVSVDGNKDCREYQDHRNTSKKRKMVTTWTEQVKVNSENGLEGPADDRYSWRKYGQKDILAAKYPRSYYRCTYRSVQNCWAIKQVQRSDEDPTVFDIVYKGTHTCKQSTNAVPAPAASPEKQQLEHNSNSQHHELHLLSSLKANLRVDTENLENEYNATHFSFPSTLGCNDGEIYDHPISAVDGNYESSYSQLFLSPAASESNYFSATTYPMKSNWELNPQQHSEVDFSEIISAHPSASNSPTEGMEFSIDHLLLDPNSSFNFTEYFSYSNIEC